MKFVAAKALGFSLAKPVEAQPRGLNSVSSDCFRMRRFLRKSGAPRTLINPLSWSWSRLDGNLAACALTGIYSSSWVTLITQQGLTLDDLKGAWDWT
jgi:hypothetical protein